MKCNNENALIRKGVWNQEQKNPNKELNQLKEIESE